MIQDQATISNPAAIPVLPSIAGFAGGYDAWLCDIWGVIHNGHSAFLAACDACSQFRARGGTVVLISNAPRPRASVMLSLDALLVPRSSYDAIVTSGDVTRELLVASRARRIFHLGPERDLPIFEGLDIAFGTPDDCELVVNSGLFDDLSETPDDYAGMLAQFKARGLTMICANPDLVVEKGASLLYCAGALAQAYEALGGAVAYAGKPHPPVYDMAFDAITRLHGGRVAKSRVLAIGDGLRTDIAGAEAAGLDAVFIPSRVHLAGGEEASAAEINALFAGKAFRPKAAQNGLRW